MNGETGTHNLWERECLVGDSGMKFLREQFFCEPDVEPCHPVDRPAHYRRFNVEVIDIIRHVLGEEGFRAYCIGNEVKYRLRAGFKNDGAEDLAKAMKYYEFRGGK